jgi:hypothetical protein
VTGRKCAYIWQARAEGHTRQTPPAKMAVPVRIQYMATPLNVLASRAGAIFPTSGPSCVPPSQDSALLVYFALPGTQNPAAVAAAITVLNTTLAPAATSASGSASSSSQGQNTRLFGNPSSAASSSAVGNTSSSSQVPATTQQNPGAGSASPPPLSPKGDAAASSSAAGSASLPEKFHISEEEKKDAISTINTGAGEWEYATTLTDLRDISANLSKAAKKTNFYSTNKEEREAADLAHRVDKMMRFIEQVRDFNLYASKNLRNADSARDFILVRLTFICNKNADAITLFEDKIKTISLDLTTDVQSTFGDFLLDVAREDVGEFTTNVYSCYIRSSCENPDAAIYNRAIKTLTTINTIALDLDASNDKYVNALTALQQYYGRVTSNPPNYTSTTILGVATFIPRDKTHSQTSGVPLGVSSTGDAAAAFWEAAKEHVSGLRGVRALRSTARAVGALPDEPTTGAGAEYARALHEFVHRYVGGKADASTVRRVALDVASIARLPEAAPGTTRPSIAAATAADASRVQLAALGAALRSLSSVP